MTEDLVIDLSDTDSEPENLIDFLEKRGFDTDIKEEVVLQVTLHVAR
jgi:hypothetical protein